MTSLYWISGSAPAWRVLLALELKTISYDSIVLETSRKDQKSDWFLKINPRGTIPVLEDSGRVICQSLAILHYLEYRRPSPGLSGSDPAQAGRIFQTMYELLDIVDPLVNRIVQPAFRDKVDASIEDMKLAAKSLNLELGLLDEQLATSGWLAADSISLADVVFVPSWQRLVRALNKRPDVAAACELESLQDKYPNLCRWQENTEALAAFDKTFPPHWRRR